MTLSVFLPSSTLSRDIFLRVVDEKMIFTDDLACRQYFRRRCTHRQKKEKRKSGSATFRLSLENETQYSDMCRGKTEKGNRTIYSAKKGM